MVINSTELNLGKEKFLNHINGEKNSIEKVSSPCQHKNIDYVMSANHWTSSTSLWSGNWPQDPKMLKDTL